MATESIAEQPDAQRDLRTHLRGMWAGVAGAWAEHAAFIDERSTALTTRMLELTAPQPGDRVLELACGPGGLGLQATPRVVPGGEVVLSDVAEEMTAIAAARAAALGLDHVRTRELDIEAIDEPDAGYDVVLCREGLMFATDPARAAGEIRRVLRPAGRVAIAVWGPRERNPWLGCVLDTVGEQLGVPMPPPGIPGPFALSDPVALGALLTGAGLADVVVDELPVPLHTVSFEDWWARTSALAGPLAKILGNLAPEAVQGIRARLQEAVVPYENAAGGLDFPGVTLLASARRG